MEHSLVINIKSDDESKITSILKHILNEIEKKENYYNSEVEDYSDLESLKWLNIKKGNYKNTKYFWEWETEINE